MPIVLVAAGVVALASFFFSSGCDDTKSNADASTGKKPNPDASQPTPQPTISTYQSVTVKGELQNLVAGKKEGKKGCYALSSVAGDFQSKPRASVSFIDVDGQKTDLPDFPEASLRSYGSGVQLENGNLAVPYQSSTNFSADQDGKSQGVLVTDSAGQVIADHDLLLRGITRPAAVHDFSGQLYVLANNGSTDLSGPQDQVQFTQKNSTLVKIIDPQNSQNQISNSQILPLPGCFNGSQMAFTGGQFLVACGAPANMSSYGTMMMVDPVQDTVTVGSKNLIPGVGINGVAPVHSSTGKVLLTGNASNGQSLALTDGMNIIPFSVPTQVRNTYVSGGVFVGDRIAFNVTNPGVVENYLLDPSDQSTQKLGEDLKGLYAVPFVGEDGFYCSGAASTQSADQSTVQLWKTNP